MVFYILYSLIYLPVLLLWPTKILHKEKNAKKENKMHCHKQSLHKC